ncbi:type VI secretion system tip protein VgrG [Massilia violaceinigra]|uniref:Type VI secretion system tip protein VgrG n=1 Tax=Massilia violaceinigra TaxID=2045208 RepID=A0ABY4A3N9_9BURK|nr:type VI secretion system Vgr family protein [Massilia violaceinigra]UOD28181.1 type VI secretion system tip protein VgrG [Massilia violaceinigra]
MNVDEFAATLSGLTGLTEANRPIRLRLATRDGVFDDLLLVKQLRGVEMLCGGLEYSLLCVSGRPGMALKQFVANPAEIQFVTDTGALRTVCGIVAAVVEGQSDGGLATYQLTVSDALALLERTCNTRVFRDASEVEITNVILREWREANPVAARAFHFDLGHLKSYPAREFTMQYNESNAAFLRRLWKRRGIAWFMEAGAATSRGSDDIAQHTLVLFDDAMSLNTNPAGPACFRRDRATEQRDSIVAWRAVRTLTSGKVARRSWDYAQSWSMNSTHDSVNDQGVMGNAFAANLEDYLTDVPHAGASAADYRDLSALRMQNKEYKAKYFEGESGDRAMRVGQWRRIEGHPEIDAHEEHQREFVITQLRVEAENNLPKELDERVRRLFAMNDWPGARTALTQASSERDMRYTNRFSAVRRGIPIVPAFDPRMDLPRTEAQTAIVVGPLDHEIHCDKQGRIKVRFPACRPQDHAHAQGAGASDSDRDSAWLRPASGWASDRYGVISLPRAGDEVVIVFLGGDPDKPVIIGRVHGANTPPPAFSHVSVLPGDKHLSGIVSREGKAQRANQMRMDDTPGQISAQLASDHGHSQMNLGYLTQPRHDGKAEPRGEGAELRTDAALALRGGEGVLISADASVRALGHHLERDRLSGLADALSLIQLQLADLAGIHAAGAVDPAPLTLLGDHVRKWEDGSNTVPEKAPSEGGAPIVAIEAPAGIMLGSQAGVTVGAQTHIDLVSVANTQVSAGRRLILHAMKSISLFAHALGVKLIAASGKVEIQAHDDNVEITAARRIILSASDEIIMQAPKITMVTKGAQVAIGDGVITHQCTGTYTVKSANVVFTGGGDGNPVKLRMPQSVVAHDQRVRIVDLSSGDILANRRYRVTMEDGQIIEGRTDAEGLTAVLTSTIPFGHFTIEALSDEPV